MAKKAPAKRAPAKRKPRPKKPVVPAIEERERLIEQVIAEMAKSHVPIVDPTDDGEPVDITSWIPVFLKYAATLLIGAGIGIWSAGGIPIGGDVVPSDCLSEAHAADRVTQIAVLRELAEQPFDGTTDDGRRKAGEWFNAQRFRNRADDLGPFTDAVAEAIAANSEADLAKKLEGK